MKTKINNKKFMVILITVLLAVTAIGGTLAYLTATTNTETNQFRFSNNNLTATLTEPSWIPANALNLVPASITPKDPQVNNTCSLGEYVAVRVIFKNGEGNVLSADDYTKLMSYIEIDYNSTDWEAAAAGPTTIYYYKSLLAGNTPTEKLFTTVKVKNSVTNTELTWLRDTLKGFDIVLEGAAVQADAFPSMNADVKTALIGLFS